MFLKGQWNNTSVKDFITCGDYNETKRNTPSRDGLVLREEFILVSYSRIYFSST